jgi:pentapeptide MXKDX repeat protein
MKTPIAFIAAAAILGSTTLVLAFNAPATPVISGVQLAQAKMDDKMKKDDMMKDDKMAKDKMAKDKMSKDDKMMKDDKMKK